MAQPQSPDKTIQARRRPMHITTITDAAEWPAWAERWNALLAHSHLQSPFLTYEFQQAWWQHRGGGEWPDAQLYLVLALDDDEQLLGIAPLFSASEDGERLLLPIGSHEIADFLDLIVRPGDHAAFTAALLEHLNGPDAPDFERLDFYNLLDESASLAQLESAAGKAGWDLDKQVLQPSPFIDIPATFGDYLERLDSGDARELRRKMRRAARYAGPVSMELVESDHPEFEQALGDFFGLMTQEADKASFLSTGMRDQMLAIARAAAAGGWLQLAFLKVGHERIAAYLNFDYGNRIWAYNSGFANQYADLSPGWLLMAELIDWCIENGRSAIDFMRGDEEYKYRFGGVNRFVLKASLSPA